jgi:hypothetical protein
VVGPQDAVERVWRDDGPRLWRSTRNLKNCCSARNRLFAVAGFQWASTSSRYASTCSRAIAETSVGMPRDRANAASWPTASEYDWTVFGLRFAARSARAKLKPSVSMSATLDVKVGVMGRLPCVRCSCNVVP